MKKSLVRRVTAGLALAVFIAAPAAAQTRLTLADAIKRATDHSEALDITRAGESRADADLMRARSARMPQVSFAGSYERTLASEFSSALGSGGPVCAPLSVDATRPLGDRLTELERAAGCGGIGSGFDFGNLPFGQRNIYRASFSFAQALYTGGRITAQQTQADLSHRNATLATTSAEALLALEVTRAFYDAALSDRLAAIAESGYTQASAAYDQTKVSFDAGRQPEFELLRAQVARDNQRPVMIRRRADREVAYLRLRQLLELPATEALVLDIELTEDGIAAPAPFVEGLERARVTQGTDDRVTVQQAQVAVQVREAGVQLARADRLPSVSLSSSLSPVGYPSSGVLPTFGDFRTNWTLGATVQVPIFTGQRLKANELSARADLAEAEARLKQARELSELDAATARQDLTAAEAVWEASAGTIQQAERAYQIAELRNREGLSTQLELSDSRLSLQLAQANRAQAARDLQVARARVALLPNLPFIAR